MASVCWRTSIAINIGGAVGHGPGLVSASRGLASCRSALRLPCAVSDGHEVSGSIAQSHDVRDRSEDGRRLGTAGDDMQLRVWDVSAGAPVASPVAGFESVRE
jgi:hypothetical protein